MILNSKMDQEVEFVLNQKGQDTYTVSTDILRAKRIKVAALYGGA